ncbi:MAG: penicillin acylase family protein, partial [candidate division KSB1 bacterium]|nr:penicillin acylase family protein [candidate division KSB1 bacterium]
LKAENWNQFVAGLRYFAVPPQNWVYADRDGNIGYYCAGSIPIRKQGNGLLPQPGWTGDFEWLGQIPFDQLPHLFNPAENMIITANNKVTDSKYPYFISTYWEPPYRAHRIQELLNMKSNMQASDFKAIQLDVFSAHAQYLMPEILAALPKFDQSSSLRTYFASSLKNWDFQLTANSIGATAFEVFLTCFIKNIFWDELGDTLFSKFIELPNIPIRVTDRLVARGQSIWFDNKLTPDTSETLTDVILTSLEETFKYLCDQYGETVYDWRWGNVHQVKFEHVMARNNRLDRWLNLGPDPVGGSGTSVNAASYSLDRKNFRAIVGPSLRQIIDLSNRTRSLLVLPTGQSGNPFSRHYRDQYPLWLSGGYHSTLVDSALICNSNFNLLLLTPTTGAH